MELSLAALARLQPPNLGLASSLVSHRTVMSSVVVHMFPVRIRILNNTTALMPASNRRDDFILYP